MALVILIDCSRDVCRFLLIKSCAYRADFKFLLGCTLNTINPNSAERATALIGQYDGPVMPNGQEPHRDSYIRLLAAELLSNFHGVSAICLT